MSELCNATTNEIHDELAKRNEAVVTLCYKSLDADRQETYRRYHGGWTLILGMLSAAVIEVESAFLEARGE